MTNLFAKGYMYKSELQSSMSRIGALLQIPDKTVDVASQRVVLDALDDPALVVYVKDGWFSWRPNEPSKQTDQAQKSGSVLRNVNLKIRAGELVGVCGPVGSGKSSLIYAVLGEIYLQSGTLSLKSQKIAYCPQVPWIISGTIKENILFGQPLRQEWFLEVLKACSLDIDVSRWDLGEETVVGDNGVALSGGQRARIGLARAAYSNADIYLLDDPLSAVDTKVGKHLFEKCIRGILKKKAILLVTHLIHYVQQCDQVLLIENGSMNIQGSFLQISSLKESVFALAMKSYTTELNQGEFDNESAISDTELKEEAARISIAKRKSAAGNRESCASNGSEAYAAKLILDDSDRPDIGIKAYMDYISAGASLFGIICLFALVLFGQGISIGADMFLARWSAMSFVDQRLAMNVGIYTSLSTFVLVFSIARSMSFFLVCASSSNNLFRKMTRAVFSTSMQFFNSKSQGAIVNRFGKDTLLVDEILPQTAFDLVQRTLMILATILISAIVIPYILIVIPFLIIGLLYYRKRYLKSSKQMNQLEVVTRAPIYSFISNSIQGASLIRSFGVENTFRKEFIQIQNQNTRVYFAYTTSGRWLGSNLNIVSAFFLIVVFFLCIALRDNLGLTASGIGLLLSYTLQLTGSLQWTIRQSAELENLMLSSDRIVEYTTLKPEQDSNIKIVPPIDWPQFGSIEIKSMSLAYPGSNVSVLKDLTVYIPAGCKVGVVGRSGAGKSTLIQAFFRLMEPNPAKSIVIDNIATSDVSLLNLRKPLAIIPQEPVYFNASLRFNLDPFGESSDSQLWDALQTVNLKTMVKSSALKLDGKCNFSNAVSLSMGERQLVCLARAILKKSKIIIMDEATSAMDISTEQVIQDVLTRGAFQTSTVITIAHRLSTIIDYDLILVLDDGRLVEQGSPRDLLSKDSDAWFQRMFQELTTESQQLLHRVLLQKYSKS